LPKLLVIADDLTGAADTAAQFANQGVDTVVVVDWAAEWKRGAASCEVLVVNTESRHLSADEAAERVRATAIRGATLGATHYYKKTDSTLRGNIGAELEALRVVAGRRVLSYLPAYPKLGRSTLRGTQYVGAQQLRETTFSSDPLAPVTHSYVPSIIAAQTTTRCLLVNTTSLPSAEAKTGDAIWLFDAETEDDLLKAGELLKKSDMLVATAGSAGFAEYLPRLLGLETKRSESPRARGPLLVAAGSLNEITLRQLAHAEAAGFASITLTPAVLATGRGPLTADGRRAVAEILAHSRLGHDVIVRSVSETGDISRYLECAISRGLDDTNLHAFVSNNLAEVVAMAIEAGEFGVLVVLGGDTMLAIARSLSWCSLMCCGEVMPGVAVSQVQGRSGAPLVVSKAGGFGEVDVLTKVKELLGHEAKWR
jgi:uncharacterized protein YgbK (DUF1537 family)